MILLQSNDKYDELIEYNHQSGRYTRVSRKKLSGRVNSQTDGFFAMLSATLVALYKFEQQLFFRIRDDCIPLTDDTIVRVDGDTHSRRLMVEKSGKQVAHLDYVADFSEQFPNDPTPFIDDENFDFGLFASNISKSEKRKKVLLDR